jgi:hypothetical protein
MDAACGNDTRLFVYLSFCLLVCLDCLTASFAGLDDFCCATCLPSCLSSTNHIYLAPSRPLARSLTHSLTTLTSQPHTLNQPQPTLAYPPPVCCSFPARCSHLASAVPPLLTSLLTASPLLVFPLLLLLHSRSRAARTRWFFPVLLFFGWDTRGFGGWARTYVRSFVGAADARSPSGRCDYSLFGVRDTESVG